MKEEDIKRKIVESAQDMEVPDSLQPESIQWRLQKESKRRKKGMIQKAVVAACLSLALGLSGTAVQNMGNLPSGNGQGPKQELTLSTAQNKGTKKDSQDKDTKKKTTKTAKDTKTAKATKTKTKAKSAKKLGKLYKMANSYDQVYKVLKKGSIGRYDYTEYVEYAADEDYATAEAADGMAVPNAAGSAADTGTSNSASSAKVSENADAVEAAEDGGYSSTNLQVEGVDESDIVKTDGKYLYIVKEQEIKILDLQNKVPQLAATLEPQGLSDEGWIREMYVADGKLVLITEQDETSLEDTTYMEGRDAAASKKVAAYDVAGFGYRIHTKLQTKILTYDVSNPKKPVFLADTVQDGSYQTSRKVGEKLYLFTTNYLYAEEAAENDGSTGDIWLPTVDGKNLAVKSIYIPKRGNSSILMSCVQLGNTNKVLDSKLLINDGAEYYVTKDSIYIYRTNWDYSSDDYVEKTQLARFALTEDGKILAVAAKTVRGSIEDTFAINEQGGYLRVLTTVTSSDTWENRVYVLDEKLNLMGRLTGLAEGERIYSARFFGNTGYFVTYRNTDPLFTVDLSDPKQPKIIGELKITGFSEYLHFWGNDRLLGIGYETDEDSGERKGMKLTMFNISKPEKVTVEACMVLGDADYSQALYDYKSVLIDQKKNVIAFTTETYRDEYRTNYRVYSYQNGKFRKCLNQKLEEDGYWYDLRSLYSNNVLYLAGQRKTIAFDMKDDYKKLGQLKY